MAFPYFPYDIQNIIDHYLHNLKFHDVMNDFKSSIHQSVNLNISYYLMIVNDSRPDFKFKHCVVWNIDPGDIDLYMAMTRHS